MKTKFSRPTVMAIRTTTPLSAHGARNGHDFVCWCGEPSDRLGLWQEHDERDLPTEELVFVGGSDHASCNKGLRKHPRLYTEVMGTPGRFPAVCGPCTWREGFACKHPKLKANGGAGLLVQLRPLVPANVIICPPPSGPKARAEGCEGIDVSREVAGG